MTAVAPAGLDKSSSSERHRLGLLGSIACASKRLTSELLQRVAIQGDDVRPVPLRTNPELFCTFRDAIMNEICSRFKEDPALEEIVYEFARATPPLFERLEEEHSEYELYWPLHLKISVTCRDNIVTVAFTDYFRGRYDVEVYRAKLLSRPTR